MPQRVTADAAGRRKFSNAPLDLIATIVIRKRIVEPGIDSRVKRFLLRHCFPSNRGKVERGRALNERRAPLLRPGTAESSCCLSCRSSYLAWDRNRPCSNTTRRFGLCNKHDCSCRPSWTCSKTCPCCPPCNSLPCRSSRRRFGCCSGVDLESELRLK